MPKNLPSGPVSEQGSCIFFFACFGEELRQYTVALRPHLPRLNHTSLLVKLILFTCIYLFIFLCKKCFSSAQQNMEV